MVKPVPSGSRIIESPIGAREEVFPLPVTERFLAELVTDLFETYWERLIFGPLIEGAAYEIRAPRQPSKIGLMDGYLTIFFGRTHFHLCIGDNKGSPSAPTPPALRRHRRTRRAEFYRGLNVSSEPVTWGFRLFNGAGEQQMTVLFPNPFIGDDDEILDLPDWSRLAMWEDVLRRYTGREPDGRDRLARGFKCG